MELTPVMKAAMKTHRDLLTILMDLREDQVKDLLDYEMEDRNPRQSVVERLHQRFCILRAQRERAEMMAEIS